MPEVLGELAKLFRVGRLGEEFKRYGLRYEECIWLEKLSGMILDVEDEFAPDINM